ncbi:hypothetical protein HYH02_013322 [Chlamydomonas schloesseri]|uniref:RING-type E3 ubiquitin transferase n=1 Tax=Chlamydomonas schloesseri TaxID=2026947 RepID=A0A835SQ89_9CHLO|nr:hypothetical protein HYH02_013322 [Chlamydomonas schloesseri]|eukprot:KAG2431332.1 hypothetical protein HYH02_013322 [Chlamydomonas schloesseri]
MAPDFKKSFLVHFWLTFLAGFGGGVFSSLLMMDPVNAPISLFASNSLGVTWFVCWWLMTYAPFGICERIHSIPPIKALTKLCVTFMRANLIISRVDLAVTKYPGVIAAPLILGTIAGAGGKLITDGIRGGWGALPGTAEATAPTFVWRSAALAAVGYWGVCKYTNLLTSQEAAAVVITVLLLHSIISDLAGPAAADFTYPVARVAHAITLVPMPGAPAAASALPSKAKKATEQQHAKAAAKSGSVQPAISAASSGAAVKQPPPAAAPAPTKSSSGKNNANGVVVKADSSTAKSGKQESKKKNGVPADASGRGVARERTRGRGGEGFSRRGRLNGADHLDLQHPDQQHVQAHPDVAAIEGLGGGDTAQRPESGRGGRRGGQPRPQRGRPEGGRGVGRGGGPGGRQPVADTDIGSAAGAEDIAAVHETKAAVAAEAGSDSDSDAETLTCVICCEEVAAVAVGACTHTHTCAKCCLRLRMLYRDNKCPLCKSDNKEIVITRPPLPPGATFESLRAGELQPQNQGTDSAASSSAGPTGGSGRAHLPLWQQPRWAKGVFVLDPQAAVTAAAGGPSGTAARRRVRPLHRSLLAMTSNSCAMCDKHGKRPFGTMGLLLGHLRSAHGRSLCEVCLGAGLRFPLEYPPLEPQALAAHIEAEHPRCEFCNLHFYTRDELYAHMTQRHFTCHVCGRLGLMYRYFEDANALQVHMSEEHHPCEHPDCFGCMIAFATQDELHTHIRERHSAHMPRWDQSRARPLLFDFIGQRGPGAAAAAAAESSSGRVGARAHRSGRGGGRDGRSESARVRGVGGGASRPAIQDLEAFPSLSGLTSAAAAPSGLGDVRDTEGGLMVYDDDLGMGGGVPGSAQRGSRPAHAGQGGGGASQATAVPGPGSGPGARLAGVWGGRVAGAGTFVEDFPELGAAAAGGGGWGSNTWGRPVAAPCAPTASSATSSTLGASLRKVTVRCPCGRRVDHLALRADEEVPAMRCNRDCEAAQRRSQLANAFGVTAADSHVSYFERHRTPSYTPTLIQSAQSLGVEWVASVERELGRFLADPSAPRRTSLPAGMSQAQRALVHELATHWGLATHSTGAGAARAVQVLRSPCSGAPTRMLSGVAAATPPEEVSRMLAALPGNNGTGGWVLRLVDVEPGANMAHYLRRWEGEYVLSPGPSSGLTGPFTYLVTFSREAAFRDCCSTLGGGVRGVFRTQLDRPAAAGPSGASVSVQATPAQPPAGWTVLRSNRKAASGATSGTAAGGGFGASSGAASVRSALAADAWGEDPPERRLPNQGTGGGAGGVAARAATVFAPPGGVCEPQLPGRGPKLDLAKETKWSALRQAEEAEEEEGATGAESSLGRESVRPYAAASQTHASSTQAAGDAPISWDDD